MAAAVEARRHNLDVMVIDEQATPGGQIWRSVEMTRRRDEVLGPTYSEGRNAAELFRACGANYRPNAQIWQLEPGFRALFTSEGQVGMVEASKLLLATGAQERPAPFPGWTLPGVLTVGAAQILLKNAGEIPADPVWIAGSGPLPLLYAVQLLRAGGQIAGYLDTTPKARWREALVHLPAALKAPGDLLKGLGWTSMLRRRVRVIRDVCSIEAVGEHRITKLRYRSGSGPEVAVPAGLLLVHEGVVPSIHPALSMDCTLKWSAAQDCFVPVLDAWGESSVDGLFIAGDGAGIAGARAAQCRGTLAGIRAASKLGRLDSTSAERVAVPSRRRLARELAIRPFLDALFRPRAEVYAPADRTVICRCEEVTAGAIRAAASVGRPGPNQVKAATRAGMGPCQGRQCGYTVTRILAAMQDRSPEDVGFFHIRPPLKPVTLGELATGIGCATDDRQEGEFRSNDSHVIE